MKDLYGGTVKTFNRILLIYIISSFIIEAVFGIIAYKIGDYNYKEYKHYMGIHCVLPLVLNAGVYAANYLTLDSPNIKRERKQYVLIIALTAVGFINAVAHCSYTVSWSVIILPIFISAIWGDKKFVRFSVELSVFCIVAVVCFCFIYQEKLDMFAMVTQGFIAVLVALLSVVLSRIILQYVQINNKYLELQLKNQENLENQVSIDMMTGLYNHTAFYDELDRMIRETDKTNQKLCIAVVDIDNFKSVNDTYGHSRGDEVLIFLANTLKEVCKDQIVCRYGGEEFSVIFVGKGLHESKAIMEEVLEKFSSHNFEWCNRSITFSCGVCKHLDIRVNSEEFFRQADKYLYKAKSEGKNRVICE
jgi:diguanylate cyclase (GGDEF)-like protein